MGDIHTIRQFSELHQDAFDILMRVKKVPNQREMQLFHRAETYIKKVSWIPGIAMIAVVNSLSMYATHEDSDIDLFVVTEPGMIWLVRFCITMQLYLHGVWRHGEDIRGNFCLSFFVTTDALSMKEIAIEDDIYLYNWIASMKPLYVRAHTYTKFLQRNNWVHIPPENRKENLRYCTPAPQGKSISRALSLIWKGINILIRVFLLPYTRRSWRKKGSPFGVIISDTMLKFHDQDRRKEVRDTILNILTE